MIRKLNSLLTRLTGLVVILALPALAGAADFDAPVAAQLSLRQSGATVAAVWTGKPALTASKATLTILLTKEGSAQRQVLKQSLVLTIGRTSSVACNLPLSGAGTYRVASQLRIGMAGGQYGKTNSTRFTLSAAGKLTTVAEPVTKAAQFTSRFRPTLPTSRKPAVSRAVNYGGFTVSGQLQFTNVKFNAAHTTQAVVTQVTTEYRPIQGAKLQICDLISASSFLYYQVLGTVYPDANGRFSFRVPSNDDGDGTGRDIFLHLVADSTDCKVQDFSGGIYALDMMPKAILANSSKVLPLDWAGGSMNLGLIRLDRSQSGPWNMVDAVQAGARLVRSCRAAAPKAVVRWEAGNPDGGYFDPATKQITMRGASDNSDEFDDDVILHEYGHLVAKSMSLDKSPGGTHYFDQPSCRALAWSEGWATFFSCAARGNRFMIDSANDTKDTALVVDLESFSDIFYFDYRRGDDVEACVAAALWDIFDYVSDYRDLLSDGMTHIWPIFTGYFNATRSCTFSDFYAGWQARAYPSLTQVRSIMDVYGINYWGGLMVNSLLVKNGDDLTSSRVVVLNNVVSGAPVQYMASESSLFAGATWQPYSAAPQFTLSAGDGWKRVFFKVRNAAGRESTAKFDIIELHQIYSLSVGGGAVTRPIPDAVSYDWFRLKVSKTDRYKLIVTTSTAASPMVAVFKASDWGKGQPLFYSASPKLNIHQLFPAGEYLVLVLADPARAAVRGATYSIRLATMPVLQPGAAAVTSAFPSLYSYDSYDCYRLKVGTKQRYKLTVTPSSKLPMIVGVCKASDLTFSNPVFVGTGSAVTINQIFPAGDYVVVVLTDDSVVSKGAPTYSIAISPYSWVLTK